MKIGSVEISLAGVAYFGIQSLYLKPHNMAHYINQNLEIELARTFDFECFNNGKIIAFPSFISVSENEQCVYYLFGSNAKNVLFPDFPEVDFWFLMQTENGINDKRFLEARKTLYNALSRIEQVFSVHQIEPEKFSNFKDFEIDFSEYLTKLLLNN